MTVKVTELNKFFGTDELMVKVYKVDGYVTADVLYDVDFDNLNTGSSETFELFQTIEELQDALDVDYDIELALELPSFEFEGMSITNPFMDVTGRFEVDPCDYYGLSPEDVKIYE